MLNLPGFAFEYATKPRLTRNVLKTALGMIR